MNGKNGELKNAIDNLKHANEFTQIENTAIVYVLRGWFGSLAGIPGALGAGDDAWAFTTLFEHFTSKLNPDPNTRTRTSKKVLKILADKAKEVQDKLDEILGAENEEDERINKVTDDFTRQVIERIRREAGS